MDKDKLIEELKNECKRVKMQRNEYEQQLIHLLRRFNIIKAENKNLEYIIKNTKSITP